VATWADLVELRLRICDPAGIIAIVSVADAAARVAVTTPAKQTAYQQADDDTYWIYDFDLLAWQQVELELADVRLENLIDLYGVARAAPKAVRLIIASVGKKLGIASHSGGAESTTFQTLRDTYAFYKELAASMEEETDKEEGTSTGLYARMRRPHIGGGM
jgi:hypothetical protein